LAPPQATHRRMLLLSREIRRFFPERQYVDLH
jgi:hypothetical protein